MQVVGHRLLVKFFCLTLLNHECSLGAFSQAGAEAIAVLLADQFCLAVNYLQGSFGTGRHAEAAAIALIFINPDYFPELYVAHVYFSSYCLLLTYERLPSLVAKALPGRSTPVNTGGSFLLVHVLAALLTFCSELIGENLHLGAASRAPVERDPQISHILTGTLCH
jgi:hypothetical protein